MSAWMRRRARSASTRRASTCRTPSTWPRSGLITRSRSRRCGKTSSRIGSARPAATSPRRIRWRSTRRRTRRRNPDIGVGAAPAGTPACRGGVLESLKFHRISNLHHPGWSMDIATLAFSALYQFGDAFAFLVLSACGLAVIFGMMGVINLAHGEFIMCGAYVTASTAHAGLPLPLAIMTGAVVAALLGALVELVGIRHLYDRPLDPVVATWGLSLIATQGTLIMVGSALAGVGTPFGSFQVGQYSYSIYRLVLFASALGGLGGLYMLFNWTRFGVLARATIQVPHMAAALGGDTRLIYRLTFACGAGLAGLAGGLYAPTMTLVPTMGATFIMEAFVTVVIGGADVFLGTAPAGGVLAVVKSAMTSWQGQLFGQIGLLVAVIIVVRILPKGISGFVLRERT